MSKKIKIDNDMANVSGGFSADADVKITDIELKKLAYARLQNSNNGCSVSYWTGAISTLESGILQLKVTSRDRWLISTFFKIFKLL